MSFFPEMPPKPSAAQGTALFFHCPKKPSIGISTSLSKYKTWISIYFAKFLQINYFFKGVGQYNSLSQHGYCRKTTSADGGMLLAHLHC